MSSAHHPSALLALALVAFMLAGCKSTPNSPAPTPTATAQSPNARASAPITNTDACATRLHDICEPLLLYYAIHHQLPARLDELRALPGFEGDMLNFTCPVSHLPYVYNPIGILTNDEQPRLILYDAAPSHSGARWAIAIIEPQGNAPLITKVVGVPEARFTLQMPPPKSR